MNGKKGITIVTLIITIAILSILVTVTVVSTSESTSKGKILSFESELKEIQELVITAKEINKLEDYLVGEKIGINEIKNKLENKDISSLEEEFKKNKENENSLFKQIDVDKIGVNEQSKGKGKHGKTDYYFVSLNTNKVYYLRGIRVKNEIYFSLTEKISSVTFNDVKISEDEELESSSSKSDKFYIETSENNNVKIILSSPLISTQKLYIQVIDNLNNKYTEEITNEVKNTEYSISPIGKITNVVLTNAEKIDIILKEEKNEYIQTLSNENREKLDFIKPIISLENIDINQNFNTVTLNSKEELTYFVLPYRAKDESGFINDVIKIGTENEDILVSEIIKKGTKNDSNTIRLNSNIISVYIVGIDNAGNCSNIIDIEDIK